MMLYITKEQLAVIEQPRAFPISLCRIKSEHEKPSVKEHNVCPRCVVDIKHINAVLHRVQAHPHVHGSPKICTAFRIRYPVSHAPSSLPYETS